jgi:hypothetical protein
LGSWSEGSQERDIRTSSGFVRIQLVPEASMMGSNVEATEETARTEGRRGTRNNFPFPVVVDHYMLSDLLLWLHIVFVQLCSCFFCLYPVPVWCQNPAIIWRAVVRNLKPNRPLSYSIGLASSILKAPKFNFQ